MRAFISIHLPDKAIKKIKKIQKELERQHLFIGKFTKPENLHLTLKFLGEVSEEKIEKVKERLSEIDLSKFKARLKQGGVFSETHVRIIWIEIENINELQSLIDAKLDDLFNKEERFMSHLTIARVKKLKNRQKVVDEVKKIQLDEEFDVGKFYLMKSFLKQEGPEYKVIEEFELK